MNDFLQKFEFNYLRELFLSNGVNEAVFLTVSNEVIVKILKDHPNVLIDFISKYNYQKGILINPFREVNNVLVEEMEVDLVIDSHENSLDSSHACSEENENMSVQNEAQNESSDQENRVATDVFTYVENELFDFLNSCLQGQIILGIYKYTKRVEYKQLIDLIICREIFNDRETFKIKAEAFLYLRNQVVQLFPTGDKDVLYVRAYRNDANESVSARGTLYSHYKYVRGFLKIAKILNDSTKKSSTHDDSCIADKNVHEATLNCLTDSSREEYSSTEILQQWENTYIQRVKVLLRPDKKDNCLQQYFRSCPCLSPPLTIPLLESDFKRVIEELITQKGLTNNVAHYSSLFFNSWSELAKKIILYCKSSRIREVQNFMKCYEDFIDKGTHNSILALLVVPLLAKLPKSFKIKDETVTLTKDEICKTFILHVKDPTNVNTAQESLENWLTRYQQPVLY